MKVLLLLYSIQIVASTKLNVPKLLLPFYSTVTTNFTLEVSEGCYTW